jgi:hypothetical protein
MPLHESPASSRRITIARIVNAARPKKLPKLRSNSTKRPADDRYREQYGIILICPDEVTQQTLYAALTKLEACRIRVVTT